MILIPGRFVVPQGHCVVLEECGKFKQVLEAGCAYTNPFLCAAKSLANWQGIASKENYLMELTEQQLETSFLQCHAKDNVTVNATATVFFKIIHPELAVYEVDNLPESIEKVCLNALRSQVGNYRFDELFSKRVEISKAVTSELDSKVSRWGVKLLGVEVGKLEYDHKLYESLQKKRVAEAEKEAAIVTSEAAALSEIKEMETRLKKTQIAAEMKQIEAEADAKAYRRKKGVENEAIADLVTKIGAKEAAQILASSQAADAMKTLGQTNHKLIVMPIEASNLLKTVGFESMSQRL